MCACFSFPEYFVIYIIYFVSSPMLSISQLSVLCSFSSKLYIKLSFLFFPFFPLCILFTLGFIVFVCLLWGFVSVFVFFVTLSNVFYMLFFLSLSLEWHAMLFLRDFTVVEYSVNTHKPVRSKGGNRMRNTATGRKVFAYVFYILQM